LLAALNCKPSCPRRPLENWEKPEAAGYRSSTLESVEQTLFKTPTTSMMVVVSGKVLYRYGEIGQVSYLASARKSILFYHPAGSPGGDDSNVPSRGSQRPGTYFLYNNWDFNVAGAVFEKLTRRTIFEAFATELAGPLQMQDFQPSRQRKMGYQDQSRYLAYHFFLSGRDMARLGLVMARGGQWKGQQIVPASWVKESTRRYVKAADMHGAFKSGPAGYAYLWWIPESRTTPEWTGSFLASGNFGQYLLVLPALDMVIGNYPG
jgi:CubicO group peptidase (beta-lactamase class C family)